MKTAANRKNQTTEKKFHQSARPQVDGSFDCINGTIAEGWAIDKTHPDQPVQVCIFLDDRQIASGLADAARPDVLKAGIGNGHNGFQIQLPAAIWLSPGALVTARVSGSDTPLPGAPVIIDDKSRFTAAIDGVDAGCLVGWVRDAADASKSVRIEVLIDGATRVKGRADGAHELGGHGRFRLPLPRSLLDGRTHTFQLTIPEFERQLGVWSFVAPRPRPQPAKQAIETSKASVPAKSAPEGYVEHLTCTEGRGWAWNARRPKERLTVVAVAEGRIVGRAVCDQFRKDLLEWGKGDGAYGFTIKFDPQLQSGNALPELRIEKTKRLLLKADSAPVSALSEQPAPAVSRLPTEGTYEGHVDTITRQKATGWVWCPTAPHREIWVEALRGQRVIGRAQASEFRPDLLGYKKGTGNYGFTILFEHFLSGDEVPTIRIAPDVDNRLAGPDSLPPVTEAQQRSLKQSTLEGLLKDYAFFTQAGPDFEDQQININGHLDPEARKLLPLVFAFYLPQFHPIPENDIFWGKGFTEWRQLSRALPRFPGHYQPRTPRDLGFYTLGGEDILRQQARMALHAGIGAFCYYYYWFNGHRVLELPINTHLRSEVEMPFLLMWANENWTKTWDGLESNVLLQQDYRQEDEDPLLADLARHFNDPRYLRIAGRPLFIVYNMRQVPTPALTLDRWRRKWREKFQLEPLIFMAQAFDAIDPHAFGCDGAVEFPPHKLAVPHAGRATPDAYSPEFSGRVIAYKDFVNTSTSEPDPQFPLIKTAVPSWDNDARRPNRGFVLEHASPKKYQDWLATLVEKALDQTIHGVPIVAVNAWNEWAEAAYLEPDVHFGSAYLNATARGIADGIHRHLTPPAVASDRLRISVIMPCFNHAQFLPERIRSVLNQTLPPDEIIFLDDCSTDNSVAIAEDLLSKGRIPYRILANDQNSGQVFRQWVKGLSLASHELIWIAETDDSADPDFLQNLTSAFTAEEVLAAFGHIRCVDQKGNLLRDLDNYFDGMKHATWDTSWSVPAATAFDTDFAVRNVIPNASGLVFRKPVLTEQEINRLCEYRFAGDWYFYALVLRGGCLAYRSGAKSYFRINPQSASRSSFFGEKHLNEHQMVLQDLAQQYGVSDKSLQAHCQKLATYFPAMTAKALKTRFKKSMAELLPRKAMRICIAAHSFSIGGGEVLPLSLANKLKARGHHVTYLVLERNTSDNEPTIRQRLRADIPVVYWTDVSGSFHKFISDYQVEILNSHNVGVEIHLSRSARKVPVPYIVSMHGGYETVRELLDPHFMRFVRNNVDTWLFLSEKNKEPLLERGLPDHNFIRSFNAVPDTQTEWEDRQNFRSRHGIPADAFCLVICSRAIAEKGWQTAVDAALAADRLVRPPVHICLIGSGPMVDVIRKNHGGDTRIHLLGYIENPMRTLRCFDLAIFPSTYSGESFPLFLIECFKAGLPAVSTDIGEIPLIMGATDREPGCLVPWTLGSSEMVQAMAAAVATFVREPGKLRGARRAASATAERYTMDKLADHYVKLCEKLCREKQV